ncbi:hypothetical protein BDY21DRAFT_129578 [Lineolata rhizophorae]|uniref:Uncharacterized protein n=1 Tax=Lineolata rhizophorae TaxID=578093 RepID=A0A6A6NNV7_9PEZI|nr:hypothetical protein BDY21DRAFT_129578 [Lineolata rhizophorae]
MGLCFYAAKEGPGAASCLTTLALVALWRLPGARAASWRAGFTACKEGSFLRAPRLFFFLSSSSSTPNTLTTRQWRAGRVRNAVGLEGRREYSRRCTIYRPSLFWSSYRKCAQEVSRRTCVIGVDYMRTWDYYRYHQDVMRFVRYHPGNAFGHHYDKREACAISGGHCSCSMHSVLSNSDFTMWT